MNNSVKPYDVKREVDQVIGIMIELGLVDDQNFPSLKNINEDECEISFNGAEYVSFALSEVEYDAIYNEFRGNRSYAARFIDGGLLQIMYILGKEGVIKHRLAFYPSPDLRSFQDDPGLYLKDQLYLDVVSRRIIPFPLRFDYDEISASDLVHPRCHLTLGDAKGCRIPVSAPISPFLFVDFVLRNFYEIEDYKFADKVPNSGICFSKSITENEENLVHVRVP
ncbi:DUF2290 domain-containing protein [Salicola sp. Rm-C-2C1-2]|uniref:DUF2290 domain-containing protein n=1 Tax=Salicola sp. Rm-C-2C1-2 TaxID=3141321 RepID=UPI0032E390A3